jgi:hypothetical protein
MENASESKIYVVAIGHMRVPPVDMWRTSDFEGARRLCANMRSNGYEGTAIYDENLERLKEEIE